MNEDQVVVLLSGGLDSTTALYWAITRWGIGNVHAVTFRYGQRHASEIEAALVISAEAGVRDWKLLHAPVFSQFEDSALVVPGEDLNADHRAGDLPASFVPGRNIIFLTLASALAYKIGAKDVVIGANQVDYSGYPDCRGEFLEEMQRAIRLGFDYPNLRIHAPLLYLVKADIILLAKSLGAMDGLAHSISCYNGERPPCGKCPSCEIRAKGFAEAKIEDPALR
jgi:7-cyano-7-deazaguanine synthase